MKIREEGFEKAVACTKLYPSSELVGRVFRRAYGDGTVYYYACCCIGTKRCQWIEITTCNRWAPAGDPLVGDSITEVEADLVVRPKGG